MKELLSTEDQVIAALRRITRAVDLHSRLLLQKHGLTVPQLAALQAIGRSQPITVGGLAKAIHLSQATLTGIVARLEKRSLVTRTRGGDDRRTVLVELTDEGRRILESAPSLLHDKFRRELGKLRDWEQSQMLSMLQRIAHMMDAEEIDASPVLSAGASIAVSEELSQYLEESGLDAERPAASATSRKGRRKSTRNSDARKL